MEQESVREGLSKILGSKTFSTSPNLARLLRFCVEKTMANESASQNDIALEFRYTGFDAATHSNVRRELGRLRTKLRDYYEGEGFHDRLVISVPKALAKKGYRAVYHPKHEPAEQASQSPRYIQLTCEARRLWTLRTPVALSEAIRLYEQAIAEDPGHSAGAQAELAECFALWLLAATFQLSPPFPRPESGRTKPSPRIQNSLLPMPVSPS